jgi:hypothetical protein
VGQIRNAHKTLVVKPEDKTTLGPTRRRWEDGIKIYFTEIMFGGVD